jgi:hypothetical protein
VATCQQLLRTFARADTDPLNSSNSQTLPDQQQLSAPEPSIPTPAFRSLFVSHIAPPCHAQPSTPLLLLQVNAMTSAILSSHF